MSVGQRITEMVESLHDYVSLSSREIKVPSLIPVEEVNMIPEAEWLGCPALLRSSTVKCGILREIWIIRKSRWEQRAYYVVKKKQKWQLRVRWMTV